MEPLEENDKKEQESLLVTKALDSDPAPADGTASSVPGPLDGAASKVSRAAMYKAGLARKLSIVQLVCGVLMACFTFVTIFCVPNIHEFDLELNGVRTGSLVGLSYFMS